MARHLMQLFGMLIEVESKEVNSKEAYSKEVNNKEVNSKIVPKEVIYKQFYGCFYIRAQGHPVL